MFSKYSKIALIVIVQMFGIEVWGFDNKYCEDLGPQTMINIEQMTGVWFGVEYIVHTRNSAKYPYRIELSDTCFFIDIKELDSERTTPSYYLASTPHYQHAGLGGGGSVVPEHRYRHLVLQWDEPGNLLDYHVKFNMSRRGFWLSTPPQNGARVPDMYNHFAGTIQVLKAVSNHLVLSFCQRLPEPKLFTVILSRQQHQLDDGEIISIHSLLSKKRLSTSAVRKVCANGAVLFGIGLPTIIMALLSYVLSQTA